VENVSAVPAVLDKGHERQRTPPAARVTSGSGQDLPQAGAQIPGASIV
jgi:hypothetical protein